MLYIIIIWEGREIEVEGFSKVTGYDNKSSNTGARTPDAELVSRVVSQENP